MRKKLLVVLSCVLIIVLMIGYMVPLFREIPYETLYENIVVRLSAYRMEYKEGKEMVIESNFKKNTIVLDLKGIRYLSTKEKEKLTTSLEQMFKCKIIYDTYENLFEEGKIEEIERYGYMDIDYNGYIVYEITILPMWYDFISFHAYSKGLSIDYGNKWSYATYANGEWNTHLSKTSIEFYSD